MPTTESEEREKAISFQGVCPLFSRTFVCLTDDCRFYSSILDECRYEDLSQQEPEASKG